MEHEMLAPLEWNTIHPPLLVPEWSNLGVTRFPIPNAGRHFLIIGETGSGKTRSAIMPLAVAAFRYPDASAYSVYHDVATARGVPAETRQDLRPAMLVIDPKHEIRAVLEALGRAIGDPRPIVSLSLRHFPGVIAMFEGVDPAQRNAGELVDRMLNLTSYRDHERSNDDPFWAKQAEQIIRAFLAIDHFVYRAGGVERLTRFWQAVHDAVVEKTVERVTSTAAGDQRARQFHATYERFNEVLDRLDDAAIQLQALLRPEQMADELEQIMAGVMAFHAAANDEARGAAYDILRDTGDTIASWCEQQLHDFDRPKRGKRSMPAALHDQIVAALVAFPLLNRQLARLGERIIQLAPEPSAEHATLRTSLREQALAYNRHCYLRPHYTLFNLSTVYHRENPAADPVIDGYLAACQAFQIPAGMLVHIAALPHMAERTYSSVTAVINNFLAELASEELARYVSLNPYEPPDDSAFLSVERLVEQGACVVYSPEELTTLADVVGRSLKTRFFEQVFQRKNRVRPFFYICDEFQRYITGDKISGEQSFLDRCRAYRVVCALATQSLSSLRYSLSVSDLAGSGAMTADAALEVVRTNTGNAFYFRNSDRETQRMLRELLPAPDIAGKPHVTEVRPISSLRVGECYYLLSDGRLGRGQVTLAESERF